MSMCLRLQFELVSQSRSLMTIGRLSGCTSSVNAILAHGDAADILRQVENHIVVHDVGRLRETVQKSSTPRGRTGPPINLMRKTSGTIAR